VCRLVGARRRGASAKEGARNRVPYGVARAYAHRRVGASDGRTVLVHARARHLDGQLALLRWRKGKGPHVGYWHDAAVGGGNKRALG